MYYDQLQIPCLHCQPQEYIRMVQHLIERCLLFHMSRDDCIKALANIQPLITLTVWRGLLKENEGFFQAYFNATYSPRNMISRPVGSGREFNFKRRRVANLIDRINKS